MWIVKCKAFRGVYIMKRLMGSATPRALLSWLWNFIDAKLLIFFPEEYVDWWYLLASQKKAHIYAFLFIEITFKLWKYGLPFQNIYISEWLTYCLLDIQITQNCCLPNSMHFLSLNVGWIIIINKNNKMTVIVMALFILIYKQQKWTLAILSKSIM